ncbi:hypothetical protein IGI42_003732 [Enterococcus sp. AZ109]
MLILTKNILSEERLIKKLHHLNNEVLCSVDLLDYLRQGKNILPINYFQLVLLSETLSNAELEIFLPRLSKLSAAIVRVSDQEKLERNPSDTPWIHGWISTNDSLEKIRENLAEAIEILNGKPRWVTRANEYTRVSNLAKSDLIRTVRSTFSKMESRIFDRLLVARIKGQSINQQEMGEYLWENSGTSLNVYQLSCFIQAIEHKFNKAGILEEIITTTLDNGYQINTKFYQKWLQDEPEISHLTYQIV